MTNSEHGPYRLAHSPSHLLHRAEQLAAERFAQLVGADINLRQFRVLVAISEAPGLSQSDLVRATGIDRSTIAEMMTRMEKRGWLERSASPLDGRAHSVNLATDGATILAASIQHARAADAAITDLLPKTKARSLLNTLSKIDREATERLEKEERTARRLAKREARKAKSKAKPKAKPKGERST